VVFYVINLPQTFSSFEQFQDVVLKYSLCRRLCIGSNWRAVTSYIINGATYPGQAIPSPTQNVL
jgi:hypothetical protein